MKQDEVQELFEKFAAPLFRQPSSTMPPETMEGLAKNLWFALIAGPRIEKEVWKTLRKQRDMDPNAAEAIRQFYIDRMKPAITEEELAVLRRRYKINVKRPGGKIHLAQERIFLDVHLPAIATQKRRFAKPVAYLALGGTGLGIAVGSILMAREGAEIAAAVGAVIFAILGLMLGIWYGRFVSAMHQLGWGVPVGGLFGGLGGALIGTFAGAAVAANVGALIGAVVGGITGRLLPMAQKPQVRMIAGAVAGSAVGITVNAFVVVQHWQRALLGAGLGALAGAAIGAALFPLLFGTLSLMPKPQPQRQRQPHRPPQPPPQRPPQRRR